MEQIKVMINGLPGKMASAVFDLMTDDPRFSVLPISLTGPEITEMMAGSIGLIHAPALDNDWWQKLREKYPELIMIDFTHPGAVMENARLYRDRGFSFVMGTTGGDRQALAEIYKAEDTACKSEFWNNSAVIAPNMAKQVVLFQAMMQYAAENFSGAFAGYDLAIRESHQAGKADTSGTAKAMVRYFQKLGLKFETDMIEMIRDPGYQQNILGVPEEHLAGHGWHTYRLDSANRTVEFEFTHNVNGREIYAEGTRDAVLFLARQLAEGQTGKVFSMIDVLRG